MSASNQCPKCRRPLDGAAPHGLCPACLLEAAEGAAATPPEVEVSTLVAAPVTEHIGDRIGRYKLREKIGEGGFGVVYVAEQEEPVRRRVALKVIKMGMDTREVIARFEAERQALALMDHPNIARVLDAGATEAGRPYFVMELVKGIRITDYCDQQHLTARERLEMFTQVCQAIQHAHQKGIIHRDIKPSNILVASQDGVAVPKVIDFGISKATQGRLTDLTIYTELNQFMGTPAYMSPEQAELSSLDIDTRADIYALGVLLYELLTGKTPFDGKELLAAGLDAMRRTIREKEPARPSTRLGTMLEADRTTIARHRQTDSRKLVSLLRGELDWIVMKALEKDRKRRYDTANGFALDIKRFLADEPVSAAAPSATYRFSKFARRNKTGLAVAGAFGLLLVAATIISTWQAVRARRAEAQVKKRVIEVAAERDKKEKARQEAQALSTFLIDVFRSPDPALDGRTITVAETLDRAAHKLQIGLTNQPAEGARLQLALGSTYLALGLARDAIPLLEGVQDYYLTSDGPEHAETLNAMGQLATAYFYGGRPQEALKIREQQVAVSRRVFGPEHPSTLTEMNSLANSYPSAGREQDALKLREEVLALRRKLLGAEHPDTLLSMGNLANSYFELGRRIDALKLRQEVLALRRKVLGPRHPHTLVAMRDLVRSYESEARWEDAWPIKKEIGALERSLFSPDHPGLLPLMASRNGSEGPHTTEADAEVSLRSEVEHARENGATEPSILEGALQHLAEFYYRHKRFPLAEVLLRERIESRRKRPNAEDSDAVLGSTASLGRLMSDWAWSERVTNSSAAYERARQGEPLLRQALAGYLASTNLDPWRVFEVQSRLGGALLVSAVTDPTLTAETRDPKLVEAEGLLKLGQSNLEHYASADLKYQGDAVERLVRLYEVWNKPDKLADWKLKLKGFEASGEGTLYSPRPAQFERELIDLSEHFNATLTEPLHYKEFIGNDFASLPTGRQVFAGVNWDIRGMIQVSSRKTALSAPGFPAKVTGIKVAMRCRTLNFLHGCGWSDGTTTNAMANYVLHFSDGQTLKVPIIEGKDVLDWWTKPPEGATDLTVAWSGQNAYCQPKGASIHLYKTTWKNPRPDVEISTLDFVSEMRDAAPFLLAITAEP